VPPQEIRMTIKDNLLTIERGFWNGDAQFYRQHLDDVCVTVFTEMAGAYKRDEIAGMIKDADRWRDLNIEVKAVLEPVPGDKSDVTWKRDTVKLHCMTPGKPQQNAFIESFIGLGTRIPMSGSCPYPTTSSCSAERMERP
jgi:hypothetical protein